MILLTTLNAKYIHASLGLRYLLANMGALQAHTRLREFTIKQSTIDIAEKILSHNPRIVGIGVYIWNCEQSLALCRQLKAIQPDLIIVLGGPEVSYETERQPLYEVADYIICGAADRAFAKLCQDILDGEPPARKVLKAKPVNLSELALPYELYTDEDIQNRLLYVEASRGCPFKCEFCLSSLDKTAYPFDLDRFLNAMDELYRRGARHFKFVDRTFNLKVSTTIRILDFFLERLDEKLFLHFEVIPDHLPEKLKQVLTQFPAGHLQFEVGIQTFNPEVQSLISRKQNNAKSIANLRWLRQNTGAHIHADLIFGLPGEDLDSFADSFNQLYRCGPHEIQLGILKRLKGSPIIRHTEAYRLVFNPEPPFNILRNDRVDFKTMQRINRFARYWDMIANSGRFPNTLPLLLGDNAFENFLHFSDALFGLCGQTHQIHLQRLFPLIEQVAVSLNIDHLALRTALEADWQHNQLKGPVRLSSVISKEGHTNNNRKTTLHRKRQLKHG